MAGPEAERRRVSRELPHNAEAERSVLGAVFLQPEIPAWLDLDSEDFYEPRNRAVWQAMADLAAVGCGIDEVTLEDRLRSVGKLEPVGGLAYLAELATCVGTPGNVEHYANILRAKAVTRRVLLVAGKIQEAAAKGSEGDELLDRAHQALASVAPARRSGGARIGEIAHAEARPLVEDVERKARGESVYRGVPSGNSKLDSLTSGHPFGLVTVYGAGPGQGKTTVAMNILEAADAAGFPGLLMSAEDQRDSFALRALARESGVSIEALRNYQINVTDIRSVLHAGDRWGQRGGWWLEECAGVQVDELVRMARQYVREHGVKIVVYDYVQLVPWGTHKNADAAIGYAMRQFSALAAQEGIAVVVMSQFNREMSKAGRRPTKNDFRDSGWIEICGKLMIGLYYGPEYHAWDSSEFKSERERIWNDDHERWLSTLEMLVLKNHNGQQNVRAFAHWDRPTGRLSDSAATAAQASFGGVH